MGTGYLISLDTLVTAGHCVHDPNYGAATSIHCFIGYRGPLVQEGRQHCTARAVIAPSAWVINRDVQQDFGVVRLSRSFEGAVNILPLQIYAALSSFPSGATIGVVGYPGAGPMNYNHRGLEKGAKMYKAFVEVGEPSVKIEEGRLKYKITTYRGELFYAVYIFVLAD